MVEGYGQTESTGASFATVYEDAETGTTGGPCASVEFKLVDIPEMNYLSTDKNEKGEDQPRGEICFGGAGVFLGYYKDPVKTNEVLDHDGCCTQEMLELFSLTTRHSRSLTERKTFSSCSKVNMSLLKRLKTATSKSEV